jgi:hypothetical protein
LNTNEKKVRKEMAEWLHTVARNVESNLDLSQVYKVSTQSGTPLIELDMTMAHTIIKQSYSMDASIQID